MENAADSPFLRAAYVAGARVGDVLRDVFVDGYRLTVWERADGARASTGQELLAYEFRAPGAEAPLFEGADFGCAPGDALDSDAMLRGLLGFLTLRPGDTDSDYFAGYTAEQRAFAETDAEGLQIWSSGDGCELPAFVEVDASSGMSEYQRGCERD